jgi:hypothetical protein
MARLKFLFNPIILIWFVVLVILIPILKPGFFSFHDETHIVDVYEMTRSLQLGGFPPRFAPDFNFNLGHPYFNFYYHLPFYITTTFHYLNFSMTDSYKYMLGVSVILAASGFYLFLRNHISKTPAVIGTLVYILSPYFAVDLYVRGAPGEMFILALFPWAAYLLGNYLRKADSRNLSFAAISIFLISISHNVLLPFIYPLLFLYGLTILLIQKSNFKSYLKIIWPFLIGILLGAYYLLPALVEVKFISNYEQINIADHFPFIKQLIIPHWGYGPSIWGYLDDISFDIGTVNLILLVLSLVIFKLAKREIKILLIFFWVIFGIAVILMNSRTLFFWESIRFLRLVQFPWRMLLLTTISTAFISALAIEVFSEKFKSSTKWFLIVVFIPLIGLNIWHYHPSEYKQITDERYLQLYFSNRTFSGNGVREDISPDYHNFTEDFIPPTIWQSKRPETLLREMEFATGSGDLNFEVTGLSYDIEYQAPVPNKIIVSKAYFPGWRAKSENQWLTIEPYSEYGVIAIPIQDGQGTIHLSFENTPVRTIANLISASAAALILVLLVVGPAIWLRKNK